MHSTNDLSNRTRRPGAETLGASKWAVGCNIVVVVVFLWLVVWAILAYHYSKKLTIDGANEPVKNVAGTKFATEYDEWNRAGQIPDAQAKVFADLVGITQREDVSLWMTLLCFYTASSAMGDSSLTDAKIKQLDDVAAYASKNPRATLEDLGQFLEGHPEIRETYLAEEKNHPEIEIK